MNPNHICYTIYDSNIERFADDATTLPDDYDCEVIRIPVRGMKHRGLSSDTWRAEGNSLELVNEPENKFDSGAIAVYCAGRHIGYVPRERQGEVRKRTFSTTKMPYIVSGEHPTLFIISAK